MKKGKKVQGVDARLGVTEVAIRLKLTLQRARELIVRGSLGSVERMTNGRLYVLEKNVAAYAVARETKKEAV